MAVKQRPTLTPSNGLGTSTSIGSSLSSNQTEREREKKRRAENNIGKEFHTIDFNSLDISILRKYARVHKIKTKPTIHKQELAASVSRHFANQTVKELDTITCFLYTAHYKDSVLRLPLHI